MQDEKDMGLLFGEPPGMPPPPDLESEAVSVSGSVTVLNRRQYTYEDFAETEEPFKEVYACRKDKFLHERELIRMSEMATAVKYRGFRKAYNEYRAGLERRSLQYGGNVTEFQGQPLELDTGDWVATDTEVSRYTEKGEALASPHPIMPVERLTNIDTGVEKLKITFRKGRVDSKWRELSIEKSVLASPQKIIGLADMGIQVTSETAKNLINYLFDLENKNIDLLPERKSVSRLGYIEDEGFSPYVDGLIFDGEASFKHTFDSIQQKGNRKEWLKTVLDIRQTNVMARIVLAASFASPLVAPIGSLPFFVHLWGGESGTGKTVALMLAASVWANPEMGRYIQTFNSTVNGRELLAAFLNHLPLLVDEMQLAKDANGKSRFNVYELAEGVGKTRANRNLGINKTATWANCIITTGESPLAVESAGGGAVNRIIDIECLSGERVIDDGYTVSATLKKNYGFAGREFVERLYSGDGVEKAIELYREFFRELSANDTTEKQAMAAAVILVADALATEWIFEDNRALTVGELAGFLATRESVSAGRRAYDYMQSWVAVNSAKLDRDAPGDVYGVLEDCEDPEYGEIQIAYINSMMFRKALEEEGYSAKATLSYLKGQGLIRVSGKGFTINKRIKGVSIACTALKMNISDNGELSVAEDDWPEQTQL